MEKADCSEEYVGETGRPLGVRFKEHTRGTQPSAVHEHITATGHQCSTKDVKVLSRDDNWHRRKIRESCSIYRRQPTLNRDRGQEVPAGLLQLLSRDHPVM